MAAMRSLPIANLRHCARQTVKKLLCSILCPNFRTLDACRALAIARVQANI
jgi:hypothetical protein